MAEHDTAIGRLGALGAGAVVASRPTVEPDGRRHDQAFVWTPQRGAARVREKRYLPDEPGYWEASWYDRGEPSHDTCQVLGATVGVLLCTDLWFSRAHGPAPGPARSCSACPARRRTRRCPSGLPAGRWRRRAGDDLARRAVRDRRGGPRGGQAKSTYPRYVLE